MISADSWQRIVESLPVMVLRARPEGAFDYFSPQVTAYTGLPASALDGDGWIEIVHPDDRPSTARQWSDSIRRGTDYRIEHRLRRADGQYRWFSCQVRPLLDADGCVEMWTGVWTDVTERLETESKKQSIEHVEQMKDSAERNRHLAERIDQALAGSEITIVDIGLTPDAGMTDVESHNMRGNQGNLPGKFEAFLRKMIVPEDQERFVAEMSRVVRGETPELYVEFRPTGYAEERWRLGRGSVVRDEKGVPLRFLGTGQDITRLKRVEEEARQASEQLRIALQLARVEMWSYALVDGKIDRAKATHTNVKELLGYEQRELEEAFQAMVAKTVMPEDQARATRAVLDCIAGRTPMFEEEYRLLHKDGTYHWSLGRGVVVRDAAGTPLKFMGVGVDITRLKHAEEETRKIKERLELATQLADVWVLDLDLNGVGDEPMQARIDGFNVVDQSRVAERPPVTMLREMNELIVPEDRQLGEDAFHAVVLGNAPELNIEHRVRTPDGGIGWRQGRGKVYRDADGKPVRYLGVSHDITKVKRAEEELRRVKDRLELAVLGSKACTWTFEMDDGSIANSRATFTNVWELLGYEQAEAEHFQGGLAWLMRPDDQAPFAADVQRFFDGNGSEYERELRLRHKDGTERWQLARGVVERNAEGRAVRFSGTSVDITDRKLTEQALKDSEERFRRALRGSGVGVFAGEFPGADVASSRWTFFNMWEMLGIDPATVPSDFEGVNALTVHPDDRPAILAQFAAMVQSRSTEWESQHRVLRGDGSVLWSLTRGTIVYDDAGRVTSFLGTYVDITRLKELEAELNKSRERLELAMRGSDVAMIDGEFLGGPMQNSRWTHFNMWESMGLDPANVPPGFDRQSELHIHPDDREMVIARFGELVMQRSPDWYIEHRALHGDGSIHWRLSRGTILYDEAGHLRRFIATSVDITRLKEIEMELARAREAAEAANRAKDDFLANVSHEIRTPMNAILGMTELALDSAPTDDQRQRLSTVRSAAKNLLGIINDLLDFSKIGAGKLTLDRTDFSLRGAVGDTLRALAVRAHRKGLELLCHVAPDVPDALHGDASRLRQVLMNLVGNAIKFTPKGEVEVDVQYSSEDSTVALIISVRDTGIGIPRDKHAAIFNAFEQGDSSTTRRYGGTGLGLTISAQLAALMGGDITVDSAPGRGSVFRFTARFARSFRPETAPASAERLTDLRVLIVDDNESNRRILVEWLTSWRMRPTAVGDATAALKALATAHEDGTPFSLVLLDARMPDVDGVTLAVEIRSRWEAPAPRLILLSSDDSPALAARSREHGVLAYLLKPVQQSELLEAIWAAMNLDLDPPRAKASTGRAPDRSPVLRVLVAEDNEFNVVLLQELFAQRGHVAQFARDGRAALDLAVQGGFDLMLLDLHMPEMDGFEVVRAVREHERGARGHLPMIALTARSSARDRARCLESGMDEFLSKPIDAVVLWATVDRLMSRWPPAALGTPKVDPDLLDARAILRACGGQPSVLEKLRVVFRQTLPTQMSRVRAALAGGDLLQLREAAHQLAGTVGAFSTVVADVARTLEDAAVRQELESCAALVERLGSSCDALLAATATLSLDSLSS